MLAWWPWNQNEGRKSCYSVDESSISCSWMSSWSLQLFNGFHFIVVLKVTNLLAPKSRLLPVKPRVKQLNKQIASTYGTHMFNIVFTRTLHWPDCVHYFVYNMRWVPVLNEGNPFAIFFEINYHIVLPCNT